MIRTTTLLLSAFLLGCSSDPDETTTPIQPTPNGGAGGSTTAGAGGSTTAGTGGSTTAGAGGSTTAGAGGSTTAGTGGSTTAGAGGSTTAGKGGTGGGENKDWTAGNPNGACSAGVPPEGHPMDTTHPTSIIGTGTSASCTSTALEAAIAKGGVITFNCGGPTTIAITKTLNVPTDRDTVIDGGREITLDGKNTARILNFYSPDWRKNEHRLTLQKIALVHGKATPTKTIPPAPAPCSQGFNDGEGGAVFMRDGNLTILDSIFIGNHAAPLGPDTGGGAVYVQGSKSGVLIVGSTFEQNEASNAGAVGALFAELRIYNSLFQKNTALGHDANNNDPSKCSVINNGQNEIGSGGNGGAIYSDGVGVSVFLCGNQITDNAAGKNAFGGGLFFTSNDMSGTLTIIDTTMTGNTGGHWTNVTTGSVKNAGTAVGTNCKSITIQNSTIQGIP